MKIDRLVSIIMILLDKKRIRAHELADLFKVSLRTIYRDLDIINLAGIPVHDIWMESKRPCSRAGLSALNISIVSETKRIGWPSRISLY